MTGSPASPSDAQRLLTQDDIESPLERAFRARLDAWLQGPRPEPIRPLHWALEFPEVMRHGGFDAIVSNPPFMGGQKLSGQLGEDLREYLIQDIGTRTSAAALTCAPTSCSAISRSRRTAGLGIIATNTIAQGDTREVGLDQVVDMGWAVYRAEKSQRWPGTASLEVSLLWTGHPGRARGAHPRRESSDGHNALARSTVEDARQSVPAGGQCGPVLHRLVCPGNWLHSGTRGSAGSDRERSAEQRQYLFPYLNGEDLNSRWDCSASRWVINFHDWPIEARTGVSRLFLR